MAELKLKEFEDIYRKIQESESDEQQDMDDEDDDKIVLDKIYMQELTNKLVYLKEKINDNRNDL
jgi:hypothetical protein